MATIVKAPKMRKLADKEKPMESKISSGWDPRPDVSFTDKELPAIKDWAVGKEYVLVVKVKMKRNEEIEGKGHTARFIVVSVGAEEKEPKSEERKEKY